MDFDQMQAAWRTEDELRDGGQAAGGRRPVQSDFPTLLAALEGFERYERRVTEIKLSIVAALTLGGVVWLVARSPRSPLFVAGAVWCLASIAVAAGLMWRARFTPRREGIERPTSAFLDRAAAGLRREERAARLSVLALALCLAAGLNVELAGLGGAGIVDHAIAALFPLAVCALGLRIRDWHLGRRNKALLRFITEVQGRLAEPAER